MVYLKLRLSVYNILNGIVMTLFDTNFKAPSDCVKICIKIHYKIFRSHLKISYKSIKVLKAKTKQSEKCDVKTYKNIEYE